MKNLFISNKIPIILGITLGIMQLYVTNLSSILVYILCMVAFLLCGIIAGVNFLLKRKLKPKLIATLFLCSVSLLTLEVGLMIMDNIYHKKAEEVISYVEDYKKTHGKIPEKIKGSEIDIEGINYKADLKLDQFLVSYDLTYWIYQTYWSKDNAWMYWDNVKFTTFSVLGISFEFKPKKRISP